VEPPFYDTYVCQDGHCVAVGAIEPQFSRALLAGLNLDPAVLPDQLDRAGWPALRARIAEAFLTRTRDEWADVFGDTDACVTPVLAPEEVPDHPHIAARETIIEIDGVRQAAPAPRFSRSATTRPTSPPHPGTDTEAVLAGWKPEARAGRPPRAS
jgi:alpha-methylacyl-CoA racemase